MWLNIVKLVTEVNNFILVLSADMDSELPADVFTFFHICFLGRKACMAI